MAKIEQLHYRREPESEKKVLYAFFSPNNEESFGLPWHKIAARADEVEDIEKLVSAFAEQLRKEANDLGLTGEEADEYITNALATRTTDFSEYKYPEVTKPEDIVIDYEKGYGIESMVIDQLNQEIYVYFSEDIQKPIKFPIGKTPEEFKFDFYAEKWFETIDVQDLLNDFLGKDLGLTDKQKKKFVNEFERLEADDLTKKNIIISKYNELRVAKNLKAFPTLLALVELSGEFITFGETSKMEANIDKFERRVENYESLLDRKYIETHENYKSQKMHITVERALIGAGLALGAAKGVQVLSGMVQNNQVAQTQVTADDFELVQSGVEVTADNLDEMIERTKDNPATYKFLCGFRDYLNNSEKVVDRLKNTTKADGTLLYDAEAQESLPLTFDQYVALVFECGQLNIGDFADIIAPLARQGVDISWINENLTINDSEYFNTLNTAWMKTGLYLQVMEEGEYDLFTPIFGEGTEAARIIEDLNKAFVTKDTEQFPILFIEGLVPGNGVESFVVNVHGMQAQAIEVVKNDPLFATLEVKNHLTDDNKKITKWEHALEVNNDFCATRDRKLEELESELQVRFEKQEELRDKLDLYEKIELHISSGSSNPYFLDNGTAIEAKDLPAYLSQQKIEILEFVRDENIILGTYTQGVVEYFDNVAFGKHMGDMNPILSAYINNLYVDQYVVSNNSTVKPSGNGSSDLSPVTPSGSTAVPTPSTTTEVKEEDADDLITETGTEDKDAKDVDDETLKDGDTVKVEDNEPTPTPGVVPGTKKEEKQDIVDIEDMPEDAVVVDDEGNQIPVEKPIDDPSNPNNDGKATDDQRKEWDDLINQSNKNNNGDIEVEDLGPVSPDQVPNTASVTSEEVNSAPEITQESEVTTETVPEVSVAPAITVEAVDTITVEEFDALFNQVYEAETTSQENAEENVKTK